MTLMMNLNTTIEAIEGETMLEIERKFLIKDKAALNLTGLQCYEIKQWYISFEPVVRVRIRDNEAFLTIKGKGAVSKLEVENSIPMADAVSLLSLKKGSEVTKKRYIYPMGNFKWEIDVFEGDNEGLIIAEIELKSEDEKFPEPDFIGTEVSYDSKYSNASLAKYPRRK